MPFTPGRVDATAGQTDVPTFQWLAPVVDGFRNHVEGDYARMTSVAPEQMFLDKGRVARPHRTAVGRPHRRPAGSRL